MNTTDIIKSAEDRKYIDFEQLTKEALVAKLAEHPKRVDYRDTLEGIKSISPKTDG